MTKTTTRKKLKRKPKKILTPQEIEKNNHIGEVRSIFNKAGFSRISGISDKEFSFNGRTGDFDDVYVYENLLIFNEYTISQSDNIGTHLLKKNYLFERVLAGKEEFIKMLDEKFPDFKEKRGSKYHISQFKIIIVYCSKNIISLEHKTLVPDIIYFDYPFVKYFRSITDIIKLSSRFELFEFLGLKYEDIGDSTANSRGNKEISGTVLPEAYSNFQNGFKVVSFYTDAKTLLEKAYVLRKDGWKDEAGLYQRMIEKKKTAGIRAYLCREKRVFINNILVTLPPETKLLDVKGDFVDPSKLNKIENVSIQIPDKFGVIGIIDGQHRVYAYHEEASGENEKIIKELRGKQNLLVSGIIYPRSTPNEDRIKFEANLFLEINSTQTGAKSELKQAIGTILKPFSSESIARSVIHKLNYDGALLDIFAEYFYDTNKVKTTSIVSYALKPIVKLSGNDSFYSLWDNLNKENLISGKDYDLLEAYKQFCVEQLNEFLIPVKIITSKVNRWTTNKAVPNRVLTIAAINGFIIFLRKLIASGETGNRQYYTKKLEPIANFNFDVYKSSQYNKLAGKLYELCFTN